MREIQSYYTKIIRKDLIDRLNITHTYDTHFLKEIKLIHLSGKKTFVDISSQEDLELRLILEAFTTATWKRSKIHCKKKKGRPGSIKHEWFDFYKSSFTGVHMYSILSKIIVFLIWRKSQGDARGIARLNKKNATISFYLRDIDTAPWLFNYFGYIQLATLDIKVYLSFNNYLSCKMFMSRFQMHRYKRITTL